MEQHAIPKQVTTFEFKLIGFMTLKQFIMLAVFGLAALFFYFAIPIRVLAIMFSVMVLGLGAIVALVPIQDRTVDEWIKLFFNAFGSTTRYFYSKNNEQSSLYFLHDLYFAEDPHRVMAHIESKEKLAAYLTAKKQSDSQQTMKRKQHVHTLLQHDTKQLQAKQFVPQVKQQNSMTTQPGQSRAPQTPLNRTTSQQLQQPGQQVAQQSVTLKHPFFTGIIKNRKKIPLPGVLVYVKDAQGNSIRILKTNPHGVFATYNTLPPGEYGVEIKDPNGGYFFDTMNINVKLSNPEPFEFFSKEML